MAFYDYYAGRKVSGIGKYLNERLAKIICRDVSSAVKKGASILEIGTGNGRIARKLHADYQYTGIEANPALTQQLNNENINVTCQRVPPLNVNTASQDAIIIIHVLEHMKNLETVHALFQDMVSALKENGTLLLICPDYMDWGAYFFDFDYSHGYITTANRLTQLITDSGLTVKKRSFLFGALNFFPGSILNECLKLLFAPLNYLFKDTMFEIKGFWRAQFLFRRSIYFVCKKQ